MSSLGRLLNYGYHTKKPENHPDYGSITVSKFVTGIGLIIRERKVKQTKITKHLIKANKNSGLDNKLMEEREFDTLYTVLLPDGSKREMGQWEAQEIL
jgi:hypothetical protein